MMSARWWRSSRRQTRVGSPAIPSAWMAARSFEVGITGDDASRLPSGGHSPEKRGTHMTSTTPEQNKALVLEAFDTLFNKRDYEAASRFWSDKYIQHSAHIEPGREGLFRLIRSLPDSLRYEHGLILAERDYVIVHGRFSRHGQPAAWVAADVVRIENGVLG